MDTELYNLVRQAVSDGIGEKWLLIPGSLLFTGLGVYLAAWLKARGEKLAANQNFTHVLDQLAQTQKVTEQIQADSAMLKSYNQALGQQLATRENFEAILDQLRAQAQATEEIKSEFARQTTIAIDRIRAEFARQTAIAIQKQTRWSPLLTAVREFKDKLDGLSIRYEEPVNDPWYKRPKLPSLARDFCELLTLSEDPEPIDNWYAAGVDPDAARRNDNAVQRVRRRMLHELTYAEDSLYRTARFFGYAQRVRQELENGVLIVPDEERRSLIRLLLIVRDEVHGTSPTHPAAGIIFERQESIGEAVWDRQRDSVISDSEFREKLLRTPGWEEFTGLFRFFVDFHHKLSTEVRNTSAALEQLCAPLERVCFSEDLE